jgi:regulator of sigma E protease
VVKFTLFFLSLSFLIILHEFGHYITARWFKARVDKFYLFFDFLFPFGNILKFSLFKKKIKGTEYGIGWFPFGGYVDIAGMMADPEKPDQKPEPDEFRAKKPWQRLIILAGGITVNFLLAIIIYSMIFFAWGEEYLPTSEARYGITVDSLLTNVGLHDGDKILTVDNKPVERFSSLTSLIFIDQAKSIQVERNGKTENIPLPDLDKQLLGAENAKFLIEARFPFVLDSVLPDMPGLKVGFKKNDSLVTLNGDTLVFYQQFVKELQQHKSKEVVVGLYRNGQWMEIPVTINEEARIGVVPYPITRYLKTKTVEYGFFESWGKGWNRTIDKLAGYIKQMRLIFSREGVTKVGGFASIASVFPEGWDWQGFWEITAMLSVILAFMNLLPIPVLDGGYILFVLWEMITGKKVSDKFMNKALTVGMYLVLGLLILANGNDIYRYLIK